jgi:hypothetical protein
VRNYIAITWTPENLEACADLNLPCADVAGMLREPLSEPVLPAHLPGRCWSAGVPAVSPVAAAGG